MEPEEEEVLDDGIDPDTLLFEARLRKTLKRNSDNQILVLTVGVGGGAFVVCSVMLCVIWFLLIRCVCLGPLDLIV